MEGNSVDFVRKVDLHFNRNSTARIHGSPYGTPRRLPAEEVLEEAPCGDPPRRAGLATALACSGVVAAAPDDYVSRRLKRRLLRRRLRRRLRRLRQP